MFYLAWCRSVARTIARFRPAPAGRTARLGKPWETVLEDRTALSRFALGAVVDTPPVVSLVEATNGQLVGSFTAYPASHTGGVRTAVGEITGDRTADVVTANGPGQPTLVKVFDGESLAEVRSFLPFGAFASGASVSTGDVDADGRDDIAVAAGPGGGPRVAVYSGRTGKMIRDFFAYSPDFRGGASVALADLNGDGRADIVTGAGPGGGPHVKVFDGATGAEVASFFAFDPGLRDGVDLAAGDLDGDGKAEIVTGAGVGGGPHVRVFSGATLTETGSFFAYDPAVRTGVAVGVTRDSNGNGVGEIVTAQPGTSVLTVRDFGTMEILRTITVQGMSFGGGSIGSNPEPVNNAPEAVADAFTSQADTAFGGNLLANDTDVNTDDLRVVSTALTSSRGLPIDIAADGTFRFDPSAVPAYVALAAGQTATDSFAYIVTDGRATASAAVSITVVGVNDKPALAAIDGRTAAERKSITFTLAGTDPDAGDALTYSADNLPAGATLDAKTGAFAWVPTEAQDGPHTITFTASDAAGEFDSRTVTLLVTEANQPPAFAPIGDKVGQEHTPFAFTVAATDADVAAGVPDVLTYSAKNLPAGATLDARTGAFAWVPGEDQNGAFMVTFTATDKSGASASASALLIVGEVNDVPVFTSPTAATVGENTAAVGTVASVDPEGVAASYSIAGGADAARFVIDAATGALSFAASPDFDAAGDADGDNVYEVVVRADHGGQAIEQTLAVRVTAANEAPGVSTASVNATENATAAGVIAATDPDAGDGRTFAVTGGADAAMFVIDAATGALSFVTPPDFDAAGDANGDNVYELVVRVTDAGGLFAERAVSVAVADANEAPTAAGLPDQSATEGEPFRFDVPAFADVDGDALTYSATQADGSPLPLWITFDPATRGFGGTPPAGGRQTGGALAVRVTAADAGGLTASATFALAVQDANFAPTLVPIGNRDGSEHSPITFTVSATDADAGDTLTYSATGLPAGATLDASTGAFAWTPGEAQNGTHTVTFSVSDGHGGTASETITITVAEVNVAPAFTSGTTATAAENQTAVMTAAATDADGDPFTFSIVGGADMAWFDIDATTGVLTFHAAPNFENPADANHDNVYVVNVRVSDGMAATTQTIAVTVTDANEAPVIIWPAAATVSENQTAVSTVSAIDPDAGTTLTYSIAGGMDYGRFGIDAATGALSFNAAPNFESPQDADADNVYVVVVRASDGTLVADQTIQVTVTNADEAPAITSAATVSAAENQTLVLQVTATDPENDSVSFAIAGGSDYGRFSIDTTSGLLTFNAAPDFESPQDADADGEYVVVVRAADGPLVTDMLVRVTVTNVNEAPANTTAATANVAENTTAVLTASGTDPDAGTALSYSIAGGPDYGLFGINASTGVLTFNAAPNFETPLDTDADNVYVVSVRVSDGTFVADRVVSVTVTDVNEAPALAPTGDWGATEGNVLTFTISGSDPDAGDALTYSAANLPAGATFDAVTKTFTWNTTEASDGSYTVDFKVTDAAGLFATRSSQVNVAEANQNPTLAGVGGKGLNELTALSFTLSATDPDFVAGSPNALTYSATGLPTGATLDAATGAFAWTPGETQDGTFNVTFAVSDGVGGSDSETITITVGEVNVAPTVTSSATPTAAENQTAAATVVGSDTDRVAGSPNALTYSITGGADQAFFSINSGTGALTFNAAPNFESPADADLDNVYVVEVQVSDGLLTATQTVNVSVTNVNEAPAVTSAATASVAETVTAVQTVAATDPDAGTTLTYSIGGGADAARFAIDAATGALTFVAAPDFEAPADADADNVYVVVVRASDGLLSADRTVSVTVTDVSAALVVTSDADANDANLADGNAAHTAEWLNARAGGADTKVSLREAILAANNTAGPNAVTFNIPGGGVRTIAVGSALPWVSGPTTLDAGTQPGYAGTPLVQLDGAAAGAGVDGLTVWGDDTTVRGLAVNRFARDGVVLFGSNAVVVGNYVGLDPDGATARGNGRYGVRAAGTGAAIGGAMPTLGNVVAANLTGVYVSGEDTTLIGNRIGTNAAATAAVGNGTGVDVRFADNTVIGGTAGGAWNVIGGNTGNGVRVDGFSDQTTLLLGNYIGTDGSATAAVGNGLAGVRVQGGVVTIGGSAAGAGNVIGGNTQYGVMVEGGDVAVRGNRIGNGLGNSVLPNVIGVFVYDAPAAVGGAAVGEGNLITGNVYGVIVVGDDAAGTVIRGNTIGTGPGNQFGLQLDDAAGVTVGGPAAGDRNVISGNTSDGVNLSGAGTTGNLIQGNYIGTDAAGTAAAANGSRGVEVSNGATGNTIAGNVISGNAGEGVFLASGGNTVRGNLIGLNAAGTAKLANDIGVFVDGAAGNVIGGTTAADRNVISGNTLGGVLVTGAGAAGTLIRGNYIGTNAAGTAAVANGSAGVYLMANATGVQVGGMAWAGAGNVISGNGGHGVLVQGSGNAVNGNLIGRNAAGTADLGNAADGVRVDGASGNAIGGTSGNLIRGNAGNGVSVVGAGATGNAVLGNGIFGNGGLGIDLGNDGITANDGTAGGGVNNGMDHVVFTAANLDATGNLLYLAGYVGTGPGDTDFANTRVEYFLSDGSAANGSGREFGGHLFTGADGSFSVVIAFGMAAGDRLTATATDATGNTSEFGPNVTVNTLPAFTSSDSNSVAENQTAVVTVAATDPDAGATLTYSISGGADAGRFGINSTTGELAFNAAPNFEAPADANADNVYVVEVAVTDGQGGTATQYMFVTVTNVNEAPAITSSASPTAAENQTTAVDVNATDPDAGATLTYSIAGGADAALFGINAATGLLTFNSSPNFESPADADLDNVYVVQVQVTDGTLTTSQTISVTVTDANDAPVAANASRSTSEDVPLNSFVAATDEDLPAQTLTYSLVTGPAHGSLVFNANGTFTYTPGANYSGADSFTYRANDGTANSNTATVSLTVFNVDNDAPVVSVPGAQTVNEDTSLTLLGVSVADPDAGTSPLSVTLSGQNGTLTLATLAGLTFSTGDGTADGTMTFTGTLADINAALAGLTFMPGQDFSGAAAVFLTADDQGHSGTGGPQSDAASVAITVNAVNDAPSVTAPGAITISEDTPTALYGISVSDVDAGSSVVRVTLTATNGTATLSTLAGLSFTAGDGTADAAMTFTGTLAAVNAALAGMTLSPNANFSGAASLAVGVDDLGNAGGGGAMTGSATTAVTVSAVNDAPVISGPTAASTQMNTSVAVSGLSVTDVDAGSSPMRVTIVALFGTVTVGNLPGLTFLAGDGTADGTMIFEGTLADINLALAGLVFTPQAGFVGSGKVFLTVSDLGNTGSGGQLSDDHELNVVMNA